MISLLIDVQDVLGKGIPGDTVTVEAPAARPAEDGGVVRPFRRIIELDDEGRATIEVEPGPIVVIFHDEVDRQVVLRGIVPRDREVVTLRELIVAEIGTVDDVPGIRDALDGKADKEHRHQIADVDELADTLDGKAPVDVAVEVAGKADKEHVHQIGDVAGLITALDAAITQDELSVVEAQIDTKADKNHRHTINDVDDLRWSLDQKLNSADFRTEIDDIAGERIAELVDGAPESLDTLREVADELASQDDTIAALFAEIGKRALKKHTHVVGDVTGLSTALSGKAARTHTHEIGEVTGLNMALNSKASAEKLDALEKNLTPVTFTFNGDKWSFDHETPAGWSYWGIGRLYPAPGIYLLLRTDDFTPTLRSDTRNELSKEISDDVAVINIYEGDFIVMSYSSEGSAIVLLPLSRSA